MTLPSPLLAAALAGLLLAAGGCQSASGDDDTACLDGKCDDPGSAADRECTERCAKDEACFAACREEIALGHCAERRDDAISSAQRAFTETSIRWSCSDVAGVTVETSRDDRGQEYCEYYAIVAPPPTEEGAAAPAPVEVGRPGGNGDLAVDLGEPQIFALEDNPDATVGQCIFRSWHADIEGELPICAGSATTCPELAFAEAARLPPWVTQLGLGFRMSSTMLKMTMSVNSNEAAADLLNQCMQAPLVADPRDPANPLHDDYLRGCMKSAALFGTEWRRSDPTICAAAARAAECGCGVDTDADGVADITDVGQIATALVPPQPQEAGITLRGFSLGTWSDERGLPAGCRHLDTGDDSRTVVACDLSSSNLLAAASDLKGKCREKYGDNVVVHIPIPAAALVCTPPADGPYSATCGDMVPWTAPDAPPAQSP